MAQKHQFPLLPGTRVCLDPNAQGFDTLNQYAQGSAGHVLKAHNSIGVYKEWVKHGDGTNNLTMTVAFDNGQVMDVKFSQMLKVDAPTRDAVYYELSGGSTVRGFVDEQRVKDSLDIYIIKRGRRIEAINLWDDTRRQSVNEVVAKRIAEKLERES